MITALLNGVEMPPIEREFLITPLDKAADVETLSNDIYTDFAANRRSSYTFNYELLTEEQYNILKAAYDDQFTTLEYPSLVIAYYSVDIVARMYINEKDVWNNCGEIQNVQIIFRETAQLSSGSS